MFLTFSFKPLHFRLRYEVSTIAPRCLFLSESKRLTRKTCFFQMENEQKQYQIRKPIAALITHWSVFERLEDQGTIPLGCPLKHSAAAGGYQNDHPKSGNELCSYYLKQCFIRLLHLCGQSCDFP